MVGGQNPFDTQAIDYPSLIGPDPYHFFTTEILPKLPTVAEETAVIERLTLLYVAGSWGDPTAADQMATIILTQGRPADDRMRLELQLYAASTGSCFGWLEASLRLFDSADPKVVAAALSHMSGPWARQYREDVRALLDREDPDILRAAMASLSQIDGDPTHYPKFSKEEGGFEEGSYNSQLLEYWRNKP